MCNGPHAENESEAGGEGAASVRHLLELGYADPAEIARQRRHEAELLDQSLRTVLRLLATRNDAEALGELERLAQQHAEAPGPHRLLAIVYTRAGAFDRALTELRWLEVHGYEHAELALLRATIALQRRELDVAIDQAEYARHLQRPLPAADAILGAAFFRRGQLQAAHDAYRSALDSDPACTAAAAGMAAVCLRRGEFNASIDWGLQALEQDMRQEAVHYRLGMALARTGRRDEAVAALQMAVQLCPRLAGPHRWMARLCDGEDDARAAEHRRLAAEIVARRRAYRRSSEGCHSERSEKSGTTLDPSLRSG